MTGSVNIFTIAVFAALLALTIAILVRASRRATSTTQFWAAGRSIPGVQNGIACAGDFLGAATMLGSVGLIMLYGFDGALYSLGWLVGFFTVLLFVAERLRNAGRFTVADALSLRLGERPTRCAVAVTTLVIGVALLVTQLIAGGALLKALAGVSYPVGVLITTVGLVSYVLFGGMISVTWLQVVKALVMLAVAVVVGVWVLAKVGFDPGVLLSSAAAKSDAGPRFLLPGLYLKSTVDTVSLGIALVFGVAGLPHLLMRFFTVPDTGAARRSISWAVGVIGLVYLLTVVIGLGARALLSPAQVKAAGAGGNLAAPELVQWLGGGADAWGGQLFLAVFAAAAFATVLALVAGLVISATSAVSHDIVARVIMRGRLSDAGEVRIGRLTTLAVGVVGFALALLLQNKNIAFLAGLVYAIAASTNFPVLVLALFWRRLSTTGAVAGIVVGMLSSIVLIALSPGVWPGAHPPIGLTNPAIVSVPLAFVTCWAVSLLRPEQRARQLFPRLSVRAATGIGAEEPV
jgi:cation/acetate symporter